jgi:hypothetical protein
MVANKFGNLDKDRLGKEVADKPLGAFGSDAGVSAMIGGVGNKYPHNRVIPGGNSDKSQNRGSKVSTPAGDSVPGYVEGGFRNRAMEHKRG